MKVVSTDVASKFLMRSAQTLRQARILVPVRSNPIPWVGSTRFPLWLYQDVRVWRWRLCWREAQIAWGLAKNRSRDNPLRIAEMPPVEAIQPCITCGNVWAFQYQGKGWCSFCEGGHPKLGGIQIIDLGGFVPANRVREKLRVDSAGLSRLLQKLAPSERPKIKPIAPSSVWYEADWVDDWAWRLLGRKALVKWGVVSQRYPRHLALPVPSFLRTRCPKGHWAVRDPDDFEHIFCAECEDEHDIGS
jgi:hypothetical protein